MMNLTLKVKLETTPEQFGILKRTMERFNQACNFIADTAFELKCISKIELQPIVYYDVRERFGLSAQMTVRAISKVVEVYKRDKTIKPKFKPHGAMVYDQRILSWKGLDTASLLTLDGRIKVPIIICDYYRSRMDRIRGQADLILQNGIFYLCVVVDVPEPEKIEPVEMLGIDLGIVNLATDSDGESFSGDKVIETRKRYSALKARLQSCGTKSAKKHLRKLKGKEKRFMKDTNHIISKRMVEKAFDTGRGIALEDLNGIRNQTTVRKAQRNLHSKWAFYQLRSFIEYKGALKGVPVVAVNPAYTSQTCPICGCVDKRNRDSQDFNCIQCSYAGNADHIAAINIAGVAVNRPIVSDCSLHVNPPGTSPDALARGS